MMRQPTFEVYKAADGWRWRLKAKNHKIVADSGEAYLSKRSCIMAVKRLIDMIHATVRIYVV